ncbi:cytochrome P450 [Amycolatopsis nigrescens]|uniref:cytochrome P450 n=1 Tax=Amycolatopsis nigrescens TaxID=381445 RepID=UPI000362247C|nr:cytochrome P450 [Amycolatopsis nigrescens]
MHVADEPPIVRVRTQTGDHGWLVTRHAEVRQLLLDRRLGRTHPDPDNAPRAGEHPLLGATDLYEHETEWEEHAQMRTLLTPYFSAKRMRDLRPRVEAQVERLLDGLASERPPVDLHAAFSLPLPLQVLCELLGVPYSDRERFMALVYEMGDADDRRRSVAGQDALFGYMGELVVRKRADPGDDVISGLCSDGLADEEVAAMAGMLLFAGHESTAGQIDLGVVLLLTNPDQHELVLRNPDLAGTAVEEMLRAAETSGTGFPRYAREDIELAGVTVLAGEMVLLDLGTANSDERVFAAPGRFDVTRKPNPHLTFAHGMWHCLGAPLARMQLRAVFAALIPRFPALRLAVPPAQLRMTGNQFIGGLAELPVSW